MSPNRSNEGRTILHPTIASNGLEISVHRCPRIMIRELSHVFPSKISLKSHDETGVHAILTCQQARMSLANFDEGVDQEKDRLLETFVEWATVICDEIQEKGYFADYIDPCSGLPMKTKHTTHVYSEVEGMELLLRYRCLSAGICKILLHPVWGEAVYPASLFTDAPYNIISQIFETQRLFNDNFLA